MTFLTGCVSTPDRDNPPPQGEISRTPVGAVDTNAWDAGRGDIFSEQTLEYWSEWLTEFRRNDPVGKIPYRMLALSGGGSRGAFGAGVLSGWTLAGTRPQFEVVTGVSTGALMATPAYLGPQYDDVLSLFTTLSNEDVFTPNGKLAIVNRQGMFDTTPLRELLDRYIDDNMIDAVAAEYQEKGRTLFIGTTNLDAKVFTIWDMGKIAISDDPDRYALYRDVILASASFPIAFPPVYLPVETEDGEIYYQMHSDGGLRENVFLYDFLGEIQEKIARFGLDWYRDIDPQVYVLHNGKIFEDEKYLVVQPDTLSVAMRSLYTLMRTSNTASMFQVWASGLAHGATIHLAFIPENYDIPTGALEFDTNVMRNLYQFGYQKAIQHQAWLRRKPPKNLQELRESLDFYEEINPIDPTLEIDPAAVGLETDEDL